MRFGLSYPATVRSSWRLTILAALLAGGLAASAPADPPATVNVHGIVVGSDGIPTTGTRAWRVRFFSAETGGTQIGTPTTGTVELTSRGMFNIPVVLPAQVLAADPVWYELAIDTDTPPDGRADDDVFADRIRVHSVPFALQSKEVTGNIPAAQIGAGTVDNAEFGTLNGVTGGIQGQLDTNAAATAANTAAIAANAADIASNAAGIATNAAAIASNATSISMNAGGIATNQANIATKVSKAGDTMTGDLMGTNVTLSGALTAATVQATTGTFGTATVTIGDNLIVSGGGRIGIGAASPVEALDVSGAVRLAGGGVPATTADRLYNDSGNLFWNGVQLDVVGGAPQAFLHDFVVDAGGSVAAGDVVGILDSGNIRAGSGSHFGPEYNVGSPGRYVRAASLSATTVVIAYSKGDGSLWGVAGTVTGDTISFGSEVSITASAAAYNLDVAALSPTRCVFVYKGNNTGEARIGTVAGNTLTLDAPSQFNAANAWYPAVARLTATKIVVAWQFDNVGTSIVGDISGGSISWGSGVQFHDNAGMVGINSHAVAALSDTVFVIAYQDEGDGGQGKAKVGEVAGNVITYGGSAVLLHGPGETVRFDLETLSATQFVAAYTDNGATANYAVVGTVSGTIIAFGPEAFGAPEPHSSLAVLSPTALVVAYRGSGDRGMAKVAVISGDTITFDLPERFNRGSVYEDVTALDATTYVVGFLSDATNLVSAAVGSLPGAFVRPLGIANGAGTAGQSVPVILSGVSSNHSGLTPGAFYYARPDGSLTANPTVVGAGQAMSPTELFLDLERK